MDMNSLAHTKWECKYHIVFAPKFRRKVIYGQIKADVGNILSMLCKRKGIEIIEAECMPDHVHMFVRIPPKYSVSQIVGYLKGKSSLMRSIWPPCRRTPSPWSRRPPWYRKRSPAPPPRTCACGRRGTTAAPAMRGTSCTGA